MGQDRTSNFQGCLRAAFFACCARHNAAAKPMIAAHGPLLTETGQPTAYDLFLLWRINEVDIHFLLAQAMNK